MKVTLNVPDEGYFERVSWRLFWTCLMKVILNVPDEGYFERASWRLLWTCLMKVILDVSYEGYFERCLKISVVLLIESSLQKILRYRI
jgi:hypothetical protein